MKLLKTIEGRYVEKAHLCYGTEVTSERTKRYVINVVNVHTVIETVYKDENGDERKGALIVMSKEDGFSEGFIVRDSVENVVEHLNS